MKAIKTILAFMLIAVFAISAAAAVPTIENVQVEQSSGDYYAVVTFANQANSSEATEVFLGIDEFGTQDSVGFERISENTSTTTRTYALKDELSNYNDLKRGESYTLRVSEEDGTQATTSFLFGTIRDTEGLDTIVEEVSVNSVTLASDDQVQVINGETLRVDLRLFAQENVDNARFRVFIDGYEHSTLMESTEIFSMVEGRTYTQSLEMELPDDMSSQANYKLRIEGANDLSGLTYKEYEVYVDTQRHRVDVRDFTMTPSNNVEPGQNLVSNVRVQNRGQQDQDTVRVSINVDELDMKASSFVSNLGSGSSVTSDDMLLRVPEGAEAGEYEGTINLSYNDGYTTTLESFTFRVSEPAEVEVNDLIVSFSSMIDLVAGKEETFDVVIANPTTSAKPVSIVSEEVTWADVSVTPSLEMISAGGDATFKVTVEPRSSVTGEKDLEFTVKEGEKSLSTFTVQTYVEESGINWVNALLIVLIVLAVIVLLALVIAIARKKDNTQQQEADDFESEEYY